MRQPPGLRRRLLIVSVLWMLVLTALAPTVTRSLAVATAPALPDALAWASWCSAEYSGPEPAETQPPHSPDEGAIHCPACLVPMQAALGACLPDTEHWLRHDLRMAQPLGILPADRALSPSGLAWARAPPPA